MMVRCIDCGFCGYHINLLRGLNWEELTAELRRAFKEGRELNPPGQVLGTGHWNYLRCLRNLNEWEGFSTSGSLSQSDILKALSRNRSCSGYFKYHPGFSAPQHHGIQNQQRGFHLEQWNTRIALVALAVAIISLIVTTVRC